MSNVGLSFQGTVLGAILFLAACTNGPPPPASLSSLPNAAPTIGAINRAATPERTIVPSYTGCARNEELGAVKAAAIKQRLMVAAFTCKAEDSYNDFVRAYQSDLRNSDFDLQNFFTRMHGKSGDRALDSFKTRMANVSMTDSIKDRANYCTNAQASFDRAMANRGRSLTSFVATQEMDARAEFSPCAMATASFYR